MSKNASDAHSNTVAARATNDDFSASKLNWKSSCVKKGYMRDDFYLLIDFVWHYDGFNTSFSEDTELEKVEDEISPLNDEAADAKLEKVRGEVIFGAQFYDEPEEKNNLDTWDSYKASYYC